MQLGIVVTGGGSGAEGVCRRVQAIDEAVSINTLWSGTSDLTVLVQTGLMNGVPSPQAERENTGNSPFMRTSMARQLSVLPSL